LMGIIPAAGEGKRLGLGVKALVKLRGRHLIEYPLENMYRVGIRDAVVIEHEEGVSSVLGDVCRGVHLQYVEQEERLGIAHAISLTKPIIKKQDMLIMLGDIIYVGRDLKGMVDRFTWGNEGNYALYGMKYVKNQNLIKHSYGFEARPGAASVKIIEKPKRVKHLMPFVGLGIYVANRHLFDYIEKTPVSKLRNEVEITDTLNLLSHDIRTSAHILEGMYANINTPEDLKEVDAYLSARSVRNV